MTKPHDELFKLSLTPAAARQLCKSVLPAGAAKFFEVAELTREPESFADGLASDVLYSARSEEGAEALLYVLFEHQSSVDPLMAFRLLRYMGKIWTRWLRERKAKRPTKLPPIVPIVVYHGKRAWTAPTRFGELIELPPGFGDSAELMPSFRYLLDDLTQTTDEEIRARQAPAEASVTWIFLRRAFLPKGGGVEVWRECADLLTPLFNPPGANEVFLERLVGYSLVVGLGDLAELRKELRRVGGERAEEVAVTAGQKLVEQGIEQGRELGKEQEARDLLRQLLTAKFGEVEGRYETLVGEARVEELRTWATRILKADTPEQVFGESQSG